MFLYSQRKNQQGVEDPLEKIFIKCLYDQELKYIKCKVVNYISTNDVNGSNDNNLI